MQSLSYLCFTKAVKRRAKTKIMKLQNQANNEIYTVSSFEHGEIKFIHPVAGELIANLVVKTTGEIYATYYCNVQYKVTARFNILEPSAEMLQAIAAINKGFAKAEQEKAEARERFVNQEEYKF